MPKHVTSHGRTQSDTDKARMEIYHAYVERFGGSSNNKTKHSNNWKPMRFCVDDWVLAAWVYRCNRSSFEIGLFLCEDHTKYKRDSGLIAALGMCLSEAYNRTGKMEIQFVSSRSGEKADLDKGFEPTIPQKILAYLDSKLGLAPEKRYMLSDEEGRNIYAFLTGFSEATLKMCKRRNIDIVQASFVVHRSIWNKEQVDFFCGNALFPESIFYGGTPPEFRLTFLSDQWLLRSAVLAERFCNLLRVKSGIEEGGLKYTHNADSTIAISATKIMTFGGALESKEIRALIFADSSYSNIEAVELNPELDLIVVTKDYEIQKRAKDALKKEVVALDETMIELDMDILKRFSQSETSRRILPERADA